jgi:2-polyprenyl-6-methoxyphenol hydroxylase-like FAD-dependent oxidoreductase
MARKRETEVLIVGAGPVGLFAALRLAERGIDVTIADEDRRTALHSYALALHSRSLQLLVPSGVTSTLTRQGRRIDRVAVYRGAERHAEVDLSCLPGDFPFALAIPQSAFEGALEERLRAQKVEVLWNHRVSALAEGTGRITATVDRLENVSGGYAVATSRRVVERTFPLEARFVIGADGHHSTVRRHLQIPFRVMGEAELFAVFELSAGSDLGQELAVVLNDGAASALWPLPENGGRWSFQLRGSEGMLAAPQGGRVVVQIGQRAFPHIAEEKLRPLLDERAPWFRLDAAQVQWSVAVRFERRLVERLGSGHMWLAGDAAHLTGPLGAQSMNGGLSEADDLIRRLVEVLRNHAAPALFEDYDRNVAARWRVLLGGSEVAKGRDGVDPWTAANAPRLLSCLPATGEDLATLAAQLGITLG